MIYSVQAAQAAFPELSKQFVVIGHSQGGVAAWAAAQRQAIKPVEGCLGAVAVSPATTILDLPDPFSSLLGAAILTGVGSVFPEFDPRDVLTADGAQRMDLVTAAGGCSATSFSLLVGVDLLKVHWKENAYIKTYQSMSANGGKKMDGPLLVLHGERDNILSVQMTINAVNKTAELFPDSQLDLILLPGISDVPALTSSQRLWMDWIGDGFAHKAVERGCKRSALVHARPAASYQPELN